VNRKKLTSALVAAGIVLLAILLARLGLPYLSAAAKAFVAAVCVLLGIWLAVKAYRAFLWKVGRRLAFSYFLVGILPIPMVLLTLAIGLYLLAGFFLGHLFRDSSRQMSLELGRSALIALHDFARDGRPTTAAEPEVALGFYRQGKRVGGDERTPGRWPAWLLAPGPAQPGRGQTVHGRTSRELATSFVARKNGSPTIATAALAPGKEQLGVVALYVGDLERELSDRSDLWIELYRPEDAESDGHLNIQLGRRHVKLQRLRREETRGEAAKFFKERSRGERFWDSPFLIWFETAGSLADLESGHRVSAYVAASLKTTPRMLRRHYFSTSAEIDTAVWGALLVLAFLLLDVYIVAALMASVLIFGISRAVNRLSRATAAVQEGDFSIRIPVKRRDQIGAMQRSFNEMTANLERLVASAAQKELLDKELGIARDLQKSLLPSALPTGQGARFATLFEPSAAIGGDYFDILSFGKREIAVMIADVSGHGLPTGLRMAMVKAALQILVEEIAEPVEILRRLDRVVRSGDSARFFVTATLARIDLATGKLELTNAGHPPTYLLRQGVVREIVLPGSPLGALRQVYGQETIQLEAGDLVVWLSDGLIEALDANDEPFGYESVVRALSGSADTPEELRDRLLAAIALHVGTTPSQDDRTLVVFRYEPVG